MKIDLISDATEITADLKNKDDYLGAIKVVLPKIKKHFQNGIPVRVIESHMAALFKYFQDQIANTNN